MTGGACSGTPCKFAGSTVFLKTIRLSRPLPFENVDYPGQFIGIVAMGWNGGLKFGDFRERPAAYHCFLRVLFDQLDVIFRCFQIPFFGRGVRTK